MVFDSTSGRKKPTSPRALFSFLSWIKILCSGCFGKVLRLKKQACSIEGRMISVTNAKRLAKLDVGDDSVGKLRTELFAWETPKREEEEGDMFEGTFYVGSKELTEVELRSPVEESKGVATIVKASRSCTSVPVTSSSLLPVVKASQNERSLASNNGDIPTLPQKTDTKPGKIEAPSKPIDIVSSSACCRAAKSLWMVPSFLPEAGKFPKEATIADRKDRILGVSMPERCKTTENLCQQRMNSRLRSRSLTDQDFTELRGCIDLGFVFTQDDVPDLRDTLPALEVCYAITQKLHDPHQCSTPPVSPRAESRSPSPRSSLTSPISSWKIASPGDQPQQVKARLRHWAQAVACSVRQSC